MTIRPARVGDVPGIYEQILVFADQKLMIRRSMAELYESIREFLVAVDDENRVVGCVALHVFWEDLAEIRCLAVRRACSRPGSGSPFGRRLLETARELEIKSVFALTNAVGFFERCGYQRVDKSELPQRIWNECVRCPSFPNCMEIGADPLDRVGTGAGDRCSEPGSSRNLSSTPEAERGRGCDNATISHR